MSWGFSDEYDTVNERDRAEEIALEEFDYEWGLKHPSSLCHGGSYYPYGYPISSVGICKRSSSERRRIIDCSIDNQLYECVICPKSCKRDGYREKLEEVERLARMCIAMIDYPELWAKVLSSDSSSIKANNIENEGYARTRGSL